MNNIWDQRYAADDFVYGKKPNPFFARSLDGLEPGKILLPGEGEGRNAVYAASLGWKVDAFDQSKEGAKKAQQLAAEKGVQISYQVGSLKEYPFEKTTYDAVGLVYFHAPEPLRKLLHKKVAEVLKPGGMLILEAFHTSQLGRNSGGPPSLDLLFTREILMADFGSLDISLLEEAEEDLNEGPYHRGSAKIIRLKGRKK